MSNIALLVNIFLLSVCTPAVKKVSAEAVTVSEASVEAPRYKDGDYWVYQLSTGEQEAPIASRTDRLQNGDYRVEVKDGNIIGDPHFLNEVPTIFIDGERRWLDFPLKEGKRWEFRYFGGVGNRWVLGDAHIVKRAKRTVPAGNFEVYEIVCNEAGAGLYSGSTLFSTFYYGPQTKSVIEVEQYLLTSAGTKRNHIIVKLKSYHGKDR